MFVCIHRYVYLSSRFLNKSTLNDQATMPTMLIARILPRYTQDRHLTGSNRLARPASCVIDKTMRWGNSNRNRTQDCMDLRKHRQVR